MNALTDTAPKRIYLCISDDEAHYDEPWPECYPEDGITWSTDQPVACTVEYVRADLHEGQLVVRSDGSRCTLMEWAREVKLQRDSLASEVERLQADIAEASGALMVEIPKPGTDMARVMRANAILRRERDAAQAERDKAQSLADLRLGWYGKARKDQERAEADLTAARADAARYRWLRDRHEYNAAAANIVQEVSGDGWDAAIDAALAENK